MIGVTYDLDADAMYVSIGGGRVARTAEVGGDPCTMADLGEDGHLIGIEVIGPARPWPLRAVLRDYPVSDADASMLMQLYPQCPVMS